MIRIGREIWCLPCAGFFCYKFDNVSLLYRIPPRDHSAPFQMPPFTKPPLNIVITLEPII